jgi:Txe/YoeB family toxin of Txe-Axe toxin-antitoxin module
MKIFPVHLEIEKYVKVHNIEKKFEKQKRLFEENPFYPSLATELLEPKVMRIWSFRISGKYRALFIFRAKDKIEIIDINNHYQ